MARLRSYSALSEQLLLSVAEELKIPFLQIARTAELSLLNRNASKLFYTGEVLHTDTTHDLIREPEPSDISRSRTATAALFGGAAPHVPARELQVIQTTAEGALQLLDNYLFGARLALETSHALHQEPVSVASVLYDSGQQLDALAKAYGVELELSIGGKFGPVLANRQGLQAALTSLGHGLIAALPNLQSGRLRLQLAAHRCRYGIVAGMYSETEQLTNEAWRAGRKLYGHARQPLSTLTHSAGAGVFVADAILQAMDGELTVSRHHHLFGLGTVLKASPQLQLV